MLSNTETEVAGLGEVTAAKLVLLDLETTLEDLLGLGATDGNVASDLLVTTDTETTEGCELRERTMSVLAGTPIEYDGSSQMLLSSLAFMSESRGTHCSGPCW